MIAASQTDREPRRADEADRNPMKEKIMTIRITPFLKNALLVDAVATGATAVLALAGASLLAPLLALPQPLLFWAGVVLVPFVAMLVALSRRAEVARIAIVDVIAINALWVAASFGIVLTGLVEPNVLGVLFVAAQAIVVAGFAALQVAALRAAGAVHA